jgi:hypothetical protein
MNCLKFSEFYVGNNLNIFKSFIFYLTRFGNKIEVHLFVRFPAKITIERILDLVTGLLKNDFYSFQPRFHRILVEI